MAPLGLLITGLAIQVIFNAAIAEEFLMSSLFTVAEVALANLGLAELSEPEVDVVVGGLGLVVQHPSNEG